MERYKSCGMGEELHIEYRSRTITVLVKIRGCDEPEGRARRNEIREEAVCLIEDDVELCSAS